LLFFVAFLLLCGFGFALGDAGEARAAAAIVHAVLRRSAAAVAPGGDFERVARVVLRQPFLLYNSGRVNAFQSVPDWSARCFRFSPARFRFIICGIHIKQNLAITMSAVVCEVRERVFDFPV
jgi:hypothetical protein